MPKCIMITAEMAGKQEMHTMGEWARITGVSTSVISRRYKQKKEGRSSLTQRQVVGLDKAPDFNRCNFHPDCVNHAMASMSRRRLA